MHTPELSHLPRVTTQKAFCRGRIRTHAASNPASVSPRLIPLGHHVSGVMGGNLPGVGKCHVRLYRGQLALAQGTPGGNLPGVERVMSGCIEDN